MKSKIIGILFLVAFNHASLLFAATETIKIEHYSYKEGLTTSGINSVYKDSKGFMWLCSNPHLPIFQNAFMIILERHLLNLRRKSKNI